MYLICSCISNSYLNENICSQKESYIRNFTILIEINSYKKMHIYHPKVLCERVERLDNSRDMRWGMYIDFKHTKWSTYIVGSAAAAAKSLQSCLTLCDPIDGSPPGSPVPGILQARTLEWVAISFSNACKWKVKVKPLSRVRLLATWWTAAYQAPPSMGFSRQEYWSGVPLPSLWSCWQHA